MVVTYRKNIFTIHTFVQGTGNAAKNPRAGFRQSLAVKWENASGSYTLKNR